MPLFVDTSAWFAFIDIRTTVRATVTSLLARHRGQLVTSEYVFDETITLVRSKCGYGPARRIGDALYGGRLADVEPISASDRDAAWDLFCQRSDERLSFTDCTSFVIMRRLGLSNAISLDADFRALGFATLP